MSTDPAPQRATRPPGVVLIAVVLVLEAIALLALSVGFLLSIFGRDPISVGGSVFMTVLLLLVAAGLVAMARKLVAGFRWPRSPSLVVQLFLVILAFPFFTAGNPLIGLLLIAPAAAVILTLFSKPVIDFTTRAAGPGRTL
ncbi:hypothetical protein [Arthrobacter sp. L77]|uniref:hypothetical protein n=1 Tax=Arthrobacter sp. L77 TaxID=1496689 RepID=UPI0005BC62A7|nr:hypothetical protein [Arthrobacter sp. L77]